VFFEVLESAVGEEGAEGADVDHFLVLFLRRSLLVLFRFAFCSRVLVVWWFGGVEILAGESEMVLRGGWCCSGEGGAYFVVFGFRVAIPTSVITTFLVVFLGVG
jgi:hypothetical protein